MNNPESKPTETNTGAILNERPPGMTIEEYKVLLKIQRFVLRKKLRGRCPSRKIANLMPVRYGYNVHMR